MVIGLEGSVERVYRGVELVIPTFTICTSLKSSLTTQLHKKRKDTLVVKTVAQGASSLGLHLALPHTAV